MWCFIDECWPNQDKSELMVIGGLLVNSEFIPEIDKLIYRIKRKYFGEDRARDSQWELKGSRLLSNRSFAQDINEDSLNNRHALVKDVLGELIKEREDSESSHYIRVVASAVFGKKPQLLCPDLRNAPLPYKKLCLSINKAVQDHDAGRKAVQIFDQRVKVQTELAITLRNFNAGLALKHVHPTPFFGVSHATSCLQVADIVVYIIAKCFSGNKEFVPFYSLVKRLQWDGIENGAMLYGINSWEEGEDGRYRSTSPKKKKSRNSD
ncbi:DUF3800 domain-containing protein [Desulfarculus baarsii]